MQEIKKDEEDSDIECIGDDLFDIDYDGVEVDDVEAEESFHALQQVACKDAKVLDISLNATETPKNTRRDGTCFNCLGPHTLGECTLPHDRKKIARNRNAFGSNRKERINVESGSKFIPGKLSREAIDALNLNENEYPHWVYKMRDAGPIGGYPPGYLKWLMKETNPLEFHSDDPLFSTSTPKREAPFDVDKIVFYDGFNLIDPQSDRERAAQRRQRYPIYTKESYAEKLKEYVLVCRERQEVKSRKRRYFERGDTPSVDDVFEAPTPSRVPKALKEEQAEPKGFLVAQVDDRRMPSTDNFAEGITPFQYDNLSKPTGMLDKISELIKARKKD